MPSNKDKKIQPSFNYEYVFMQTQIEQFELEDYIQNPPMIKKLHEEKEKTRAYSTSLEEALNKERVNKHKLELQKKEADLKLEEANRAKEGLEKNLRQRQLELEETQNDLENLQREKNKIEIELTATKGKLEEAHRNSLIQFFISLAATVLTAIGVNLITTTPADWKSWIFVITGIILSCIAFLTITRGK